LDVLRQCKAQVCLWSNVLVMHLPTAITDSARSASARNTHKNRGNNNKQRSNEQQHKSLLISLKSGSTASWKDNMLRQWQRDNNNNHKHHKNHRHGHRDEEEDRHVVVRIPFMPSDKVVDPAQPPRSSSRQHQQSQLDDLDDDTEGLDYSSKQQREYEYVTPESTHPEEDQDSSYQYHNHHRSSSRYHDDDMTQSRRISDELEQLQHTEAVHEELAHQEQDHDYFYNVHENAAHTERMNGNSRSRYDARPSHVQNNESVHEDYDYHDQQAETERSSSRYARPLSHHVQNNNNIVGDNENNDSDNDKYKDDTDDDGSSTGTDDLSEDLGPLDLSGL
jgi:hypothetical protein